MMYNSCRAPGPCDCFECEEKRLESKRNKEYEPLIECIRAGKKVSLIIPREGDYMIATGCHWYSLKRAGYKINGNTPPHARMQVMYIGKHGLSQCSWGSPAQENGRAIHSVWPGQWELGLTPLDKKEPVPSPSFDTIILEEQ